MSFLKKYFVDPFLEGWKEGTRSEKLPPLPDESRAAANKAPSKEDFEQMAEEALANGYGYQKASDIFAKRHNTEAEKVYDDLSYLIACVQMEKHRDSMLDNGFEEYEFMPESNACPQCLKLAGKHFKLEDFQIGHNAPPMHRGCHCTVLPWEDEEEYEKWLDSLDDEDLTFEEWKEKQQH